MRLIPLFVVLCAGMLCFFSAPVAAQENVGTMIEPGSHPDIPDAHASGTYDWHPGYQSKRHQRVSPAANTTVDLRTYCILPEAVGVITGATATSDCALRPTEETRYPCQKEIWVRRDKCCVAIVRVELNGKIVLNPKGFQYGPIQPLRQMTRAQANELWGAEQESTSGDKVSYKLGSYQSKSDLFIDVVFHHNKIQKYRISSTLLDSSQWYRVR